MKKKATRPGARNKPAAGGRPEVSGLSLDARRSQRLKAAETLQGSRIPLKLIEIAEHGTAVAEETLGKAMQLERRLPLACKEGCDWCCHLRVGASVPEVVRIVEYLRQTLSPEELRATHERVARRDDERRQMKPAQRAASRPPCVLLVEHRCCAYPARPLTCRGFNSADASACERFVKSAGRIDEIPMYRPQQRLMTFVLDGTRAGLQAAGLQDDLLELGAALRIALDVPDAAERWLAGEPVFAPARME
jgi:Fe-S-cluster containining protein